MERFVGMWFVLFVVAGELSVTSGTAVSTVPNKGCVSKLSRDEIQAAINGIRDDLLGLETIKERMTTRSDTLMKALIADNMDACVFNTTPSIPMSFKFILGPVSMPFKMRFDIKARKDALVALAENNTPDSIFAQISIGGWWNTKSAVRACFNLQCPELLDQSEERDLLTETEYRPFWIEYDGGVVTVGKGGQVESFLEWDAGAYHSRIPSQVYVGISTWKVESGSWVFYNFCE